MAVHSLSGWVLETQSEIVTVSDVARPLLHLLSVTLHAAIATRRCWSARSVMWSPAFDSGSYTEMLRSGFTTVCMNRLTGVIPGCSRPSASLMFCKHDGRPLPLP